MSWSGRDEPVPQECPGALPQCLRDRGRDRLVAGEVPFQLRPARARPVPRALPHLPGHHGHRRPGPPRARGGHGRKLDRRTRYVPGRLRPHDEQRQRPGPLPGRMVPDPAAGADGAIAVDERPASHEVSLDKQGR